jgi:tripartite-type tricarboxylate transporter receptor subunit TctC
VPYAAGGVVDIYARIVAEQMSRALPQRLIVDNRPGADGRIGMERVLKAPANGYTLLAASPVLTAGEFLGEGFSFKASDFKGVGAIAAAVAVFVVPAASPLRTLKDFVDDARTKPGQVNVPYPGRGSSIHLGQELFFQSVGVTVNSVPYKGQAPAVIDLAAGNLGFALMHQSVALPLIQSGQLRALAVASGQRTRSLPNVPTLAEAGFSSALLVRSWAGLVVAAATPAPIVEYLSAAMQKAMGEAAVRDRLKDLDAEILDMNASQFNALIAEESRRSGALIRERKLNA